MKQFSGASSILDSAQKTLACHHETVLILDLNTRLIGTDPHAHCPLATHPRQCRPANTHQYEDVTALTLSHSLRLPSCSPKRKYQVSESSVPLVLSWITITTTFHPSGKINLSHAGLTPAHVLY